MYLNGAWNLTISYHTGVKVHPLNICSYFDSIKGCGMGPWLVLVSPCFRENLVATCKIGSFLCNFDNLLQKNVIVSFFWKSNFKMALIWKKGYF